MKVIAVPPQFVATYGATSALLLSQILYWFRPSKKTGKLKTTIVRNGRRWVAKTNTEWAEESGITPHQSKRAFAKLRKAGVIETAQWKFAGRPVTNVSLNEDAVSKLLEEAAYDQAPPSQLTHPNLHKSISADSHKSIYKENTDKEITAKAEPAKAGTSLKTMSKEGDSEENSNQKEKGSFPPAKYPFMSLPPVKELENCWIDAMAEFYPKHAVIKDGVFYGILKSLSQMPNQNRMKQALRYAVKEWSSVTYELGSKHGLKATPPYPKLQLIKMALEAVINLYLTETEHEKAVKASKAAAIAKSIAVPKTYPPAPPEPKFGDENYMPANKLEGLALMSHDWRNPFDEKTLATSVEAQKYMTKVATLLKEMDAQGVKQHPVLDSPDRVCVF